MTPELASLLDELEIKAAALHAYRGPGTTMAISCLESIFRQHGYGHTKLVLTSIAETANNDRELVAPVMWAVSDLIIAHPKWSERVSDWLSAFDRIDLGQLRKFAKRNSEAVPPRAGVATLLFGFLDSQMRPAEPVKTPSRKVA